MLSGCSGDDPIGVRRDTGVDIRVPAVSTTLTPGEHSHYCTVVVQKWAADVSLYESMYDHQT